MGSFSAAPVVHEVTTLSIMAIANFFVWSDMVLKRKKLITRLLLNRSWKFQRIQIEGQEFYIPITFSSRPTYPIDRDIDFRLSIAGQISSPLCRLSQKRAGSKLIWYLVMAHRDLKRTSFFLSAVVGEQHHDLYDFGGFLSCAQFGADIRQYLEPN